MLMAVIPLGYLGIYVSYQSIGKNGLKRLNFQQRKHSDQRKTMKHWTAPLGPFSFQEIARINARIC